MSDNDEREDAEFPDEEEFAVEETVDEPKALPEPEGPTAKKRGPGGVAWLALLLALVSVAGAGYLVLQDLRDRSAANERASAIADLSRRLATSGESLTSLDQGLSDLADSDARVAAELSRLQADLESRLQILDSLPPRMTNLENSVAALQGISTDARNAWLLAEAEYYMQIANAQLQLAGNPHLAALALHMADERVTQLADPALIEVRRTLADELAALEAMENPDIEGITLTLSSLARVVDTLPLRQASTRRDDAEVPGDDELGAFERAWASVKGVASGLVRVTPPDESAIPLMSPDAEYFLRTNLTLQLQVARLALLRGEQAVFQQSLDDASSWLRTYFDASSAQVESALDTIAEIRDDLYPVTAPDISGSLRLLRQFNTIAETAQ